MDATLNMVVFAEDVRVLDLSMRRLFKHTRPEEAGLAIWVNGSSKAVKDYCRNLADARPGTRLYFSRNIGHPDALDELMSRCETRYFVCFDMDSFPIADGWLDDLKAKLDSGASAAGVIESASGKRNKWGEYVHPSCMMFDMAEFESLKHPKHGLRFGGFSPVRADCGEMITIRIIKSGKRYDGWRYTHCHFPGELDWGFRYYGGFWCHIWMVSRLCGERRWHGKRGADWIYGLYGASPERYGELLDRFVRELGDGLPATF